MTAPFCTASWSALYAADKAGWLDVQPVRISRGVPRFWPTAKAFPTIGSLMPDGWMFSIKDLEAFSVAYQRKLDAIGADAIGQRLYELGSPYQRPLALSCFEKNASECHRRSFADWFEKQTGQQVPELENLAKNPTAANGQLRFDDQGAQEARERGSTDG